jgi:flagellar assembly protein FliH
VPRKIYKAAEVREVDSKVLITPPRVAPGKQAAEDVEELHEPEYEEVEPDIESPAEQDTEPAVSEEEQDEEPDEVLEEARKTREQAEADAAKIKEEAEEAAFKIVQQSNADAQKAREDAQSEAERIESEAREKAAGLEDEARRKAEDIIEEAKKKAFDQGREEGFRSGEEEVGRLIGQVHAILNEVIDQRRKILERTERQIIDLVLQIARKVVKTITEQEKRVIIENVKEALKKVVGDTEVIVRVNTRDMGLVTKHKKQFIEAVESLKQVKFEEDSRIEPGGCIIVTSFGEIDARIQNQLSIIEERIRELTPLGG